MLNTGSAVTYDIIAEVESVPAIASLSSALKIITDSVYSNKLAEWL
jgi:hypothetical protein